MDKTPADAPFVPPSHCPACGAAFAGAWCGACGEQRLAGRLRLRHFLRDWVSATAGLERGYLRTLAGMVRRPGETVREYLGGMRRTHCSPIRFMLWTMLGVIVAMTMLDWVLPPDFTDPFMGMAPAFLSEMMNQPQFDNGLIMNDAERAEHYRLSMRTMQINALLIPVFFAWACRWMFRRSKHTYAEHLVLSLYLFAMLAPTMVLWWFFLRTGPWWDWLVVPPLSWLYAAWVAKRFYREPYAEALGRSLGAYVIASICATPLLFVYQLVVMLG